MASLYVVHKRRLALSEAHYAGSLVSGAKILEFFGDAATELCILSDGHEGLFRAYTSIDFLAPVYAGDFLEIRATLQKKGNTSRTILFEAHKYIAASHDSPKARPLTPPERVAQATGVCVIPRE